MNDESSNWIEHAITHHGALKAKAEHAGMSTQAYAEKHQHDGGTTGHQANLGLTLMHMHNSGKSLDSKEPPMMSTENMPKG